MLLGPKAWLFIIFGVLGVFGEVVFTATADFARKRGWQLEGHSYLWMFPIYGLIAFLFPLVSDWVGGWTWFARGFAYMLAFYIVEYVTGALLKKLLGTHVWRYSGRFNLHGHIQLAHAPVWFFSGVLIESFYNDIESMAVWLAMHF